MLRLSHKRLRIVHGHGVLAEFVFILEVEVTILQLDYIQVHIHRGDFTLFAVIYRVGS